MLRLAKQLIGISVKLMVWGRRGVVGEIPFQNGVKDQQKPSFP